MPLSKIALMCLETSPLLKLDLFLKRPRLRSARVRKAKVRPSVFGAVYRRHREDPDEFFSIVHISVETFDYILEHVKDDLMTVDPISKAPEEKLFMTLRYLKGEAMNKVAITSYTSRSLAYKIIFATLNAIWKRLSPYHLRDPTPAEMNNLAQEYNDRWNFPNCIGAIGGKYIRILNPSLDINQKVVMNAVVDANFRFLGAHVIRKRNAEDSFLSNIFKISGMQCLPGTEIMLPLVIIGNEAYPLKTNLMKPYPNRASTLCAGKKMFNDRLKQARVPVDCAFEILTEKFKIFSRHFVLSLTDTRLIIKVTCLLHNVIKDREGETDPHFAKYGQLDDTNIYLNLVTHKSRRNNRASTIAISIRDQLKDYIRNN